MTVFARNCRVITNCTNRKSAGGQLLSLTPRDRKKHPIGIAEAWAAKVRDANKPIQVADLYKGRSFSDARTVASSLKGELWVVSAGLGLVKADEAVPHYDLTISTGKGSVQNALQAAQATPSDWWMALTNALGTKEPISTALAKQKGGLTLLAMPSTYLQMVATDLERLSDATLKSVRIFTSEAGASSLPMRLQSVCMPYDERLEGHDSYAGTRTDFPQRALRHFVEVVEGQNMDLDASKAAVAKSLKRLKKPTLPTRTRRTDEEILQLIASQWDRFNGHSGPLLRYLRDEAFVSCEQSRFASLWRQVKCLTGDA